MNLINDLYNKIINLLAGLAIAVNWGEFLSKTLLVAVSVTAVWANISKIRANRLDKKLKERELKSKDHA